MLEYRHIWSRDLNSCISQCVCFIKAVEGQGDGTVKRATMDPSGTTF